MLSPAKKEIRGNSGPPRCPLFSPRIPHFGGDMAFSHLFPPVLGEYFGGWNNRSGTVTPSSPHVFPFNTGIPGVYGVYLPPVFWGVYPRSVDTFIFRVQNGIFRRKRGETLRHFGTVGTPGPPFSPVLGPKGGKSPFNPKNGFGTGIPGMPGFWHFCPGRNSHDKMVGGVKTCARFVLGTHPGGVF